MKFEKLAPGMVLYDRHKHRAGNTTMRVLGEWPVEIVVVDAEARTAVVRWNGNAPVRWRERDLCRLKDWSMYDKCAEVTRGMLGVVAVKKKRNAKTTAAAAHPERHEVKP